MKDINKKNALRFIILLGFVSLFADVTYEGAKSITGQYLAILGASGAIIGFVSGFGELIGYSIRVVSGWLSDKTGKYWLITLTGYTINLVAVPALSLAGNWPLAASLIVLERFGKAIRSPAKDALLSYATQKVGRGWGFGLHEAMDQTGAILGPLFMSVILWSQGTYQKGFALLLLPALCALSVLACARLLYPSPQHLEEKKEETASRVLNKTYWIYVLAISLVGAGFVDFPLIAYHLKKENLFHDPWIPVVFSIAMASSGISSLILGKLYDRKGLLVLIGAVGVSAFFAPLVFLNIPSLAVFGMVLWGMGLGAQESIARAVIASLVSIHKRGTAYGNFNLVFGVFWFLGSAFMGYLYDVSIPFLILFSVIIQLLSIPFLVKIRA